MNQNLASQKPLRFVSALHKAVRQLSLCMEDRMAQLGLAASEAHLLNFVHVYGPCRVGELTRVMGTQKSTMTSMIDRLEDRGLLTREPNQEDRRSFLVAITEDGAELGGAGREQVWSLEQEIIAKASSTDVDALERVLAAIDEVTGVEVRQKRS